jgi:hypothetical protein
MSGIDQITLYAPDGGTGVYRRMSSSFGEGAEIDRWLRLLRPWLRIGGPAGRGYLNFGTRAAFIRWYAGAPSARDWDSAVIFVGEPELLTPAYALELPELDKRAVQAGDGRRWSARPEHGPGHDAIEALARSAEATVLLVPMLAHALRGERRITMPWTRPRLPEAAVWGLVTLLGMIGDTQPVSFVTYAGMPCGNADMPGLLVSFGPGARQVPPDPGYEALASGLVTRFASDQAELRRALACGAMLEPVGRPARIARLLDAWPRAEVRSDDIGEARPMNNEPRTARYAASQQLSGAARGDAVRCPICLGEIIDWDTLDYWRWNPAREDYEELPVPPGLNEVQLAQHLHGAYVRCPASRDDQGTAHFLPANYGRYGDPVMLGFVGLSQSGKTHLLATMVGAIENGELQDYGIMSRPLDHASHRRFLLRWVEPLLNENRQLGDTEERVKLFRDAFLMSHHGGPERPVILFDVSGGDLITEAEKTNFLWIASGLFFVIDPGHMAAHRVGDPTFGNVLSVVQDRGRRGLVSAAIVVSKADKVRFEDPVARWLRTTEATLDAAEFLRESADVYAYLHGAGSGALTMPYQRCNKATLHFASSTGGPSEGSEDYRVFPRGVTPRRVLRPLVAMLAMTGVLAGAEAEQVGI